ncbi:MAG: RNA polymerase sigma factor [Saprospiraceae bacterium]
MSEQNVIASCLKGQEVGQEQLYKLYLPYLLTIVRRYGFLAHQEPDCVQEIFIEIFGTLSKFEPQKGSLKTWIRTVAVRKLLNLKRGKNQLKLHAMEDAEEPVASPIAYEQFEIEYLMQAIASLPSGFCTVFNLFEIDGYSHNEIGEMLGISAASSRSQLSRAKQKLIVKLKPQTLKCAS